jgi:hypothetical protein
VRDADGALVATAREGVGAARQEAQGSAQAAGTPAAEAAVALRVAVGDAPRLWSPETPHLYSLRVAVRRGGGPAEGAEGGAREEVVDEVSSYAGLRTVGTAAGLKWPQLCLRTPPHLPAWCLVGLGALLRTPERSLRTSEACGGLTSSPQAAPKWRISHLNRQARQETRRATSA